MVGMLLNFMYIEGIEQASASCLKHILNLLLLSCAGTKGASLEGGKGLGRFQL